MKRQEVRLLAAGADAALLAVAGALRTRVFVDGQGVDPLVEADELDAHPGTTHAVALSPAGDVLGTGRLVDPGGVVAAGRLGRMAVEPAARGAGVGAALLVELMRAAADRGLARVELHAQVGARSLYARAGFAAYGGMFMEQGLEHVAMASDLLPGLRAVRDDDAAAVQALIGGCWAEYPGCVLDIDGEEPWMRAPATGFGGSLWVLGGALSVQACVGVRGEELKSLYVVASARGRGWGRVLVRLAERAGARRLWTDSRFTDAHRLYARLGWGRTGATRELHDLSATTELEFVRR